jgi:hypothetical protein
LTCSEEWNNCERLRYTQPTPEASTNEVDDFSRLVVQRIAFVNLALR